MSSDYEQMGGHNNDSFLEIKGPLAASIKAGSVSEEQEEYWLI